jgi:hypothetical protein
MRIFGMLVPSFRVGNVAYISDPGQCFKPSDDLKKLLAIKGNEFTQYPFIQSGTKVKVVSMAKSSFVDQGKKICYGVLVKDKVHAVTEDALSRTVPRKKKGR